MKDETWSEIDTFLLRLAGQLAGGTLLFGAIGSAINDSIGTWIGAIFGLIFGGCLTWYVSKDTKKENIPGEKDGTS